MAQMTLNKSLNTTSVINMLLSVFLILLNKRKKVSETSCYMWAGIVQIIQISQIPALHYHSTAKPHMVYSLFLWRLLCYKCPMGYSAESEPPCDYIGGKVFPVIFLELGSCLPCLNMVCGEASCLSLLSSSSIFRMKNQGQHTKKESVGISKSFQQIPMKPLLFSGLSLCLFVQFYITNQPCSGNNMFRQV